MLYLRQKKSVVKIFLKSLLVILLASGCSREGNSAGHILFEENSVAATHMESLKLAIERDSSSAKSRLLQEKLDARMDMDRIANLLNSELKKCAQKFPEGKPVPFTQNENNSSYRVLDVRLVGCRLKHDYSDLITGFAVKIKILKNGQTGYNAFLVDETGKKLAGLVFRFKDDFPGEGKTVFLFAHTGSFSKIKKFSKVVFQ